jgi:uncharacterized membrane protein YeiB
MIFLYILLAVLIWMTPGFIAFLIEAKIENFCKFDSEARKEFRICLAIGPIGLVIILWMLIYEWHLKFMDNLLKKINKKEEE